MMRLEQLGLNIDSSLITPTAANFRPTTWPPADDFPVIIDHRGEVVSRYGDPVWFLWPWAKTTMVLNFGDGPQKRGHPSITKANANVLRQLAAWWLYGPRAVQQPQLLVSRCSSVRPLFVLCSNEGIVATDLVRFPTVGDKLAEVLNRSHAEYAFSLLHQLYEQRSQVGFLLLDAEALRRLEANLPDHQKRQTPYIPPRIWAYQVNRLREVLTDFQDNRKNIEACYRFCLDAYARNFGSLADACAPRGDRKSGRSPFAFQDDRTGAVTGAVFHGEFSLTAKRFGIDSLLQKWVLQPDESIDGPGRSVKTLTTYLTLIGYVGIAYIINFSLMRIQEAWNLRADCLEVEVDEIIGKVYLLKGVTTKTVEDSDARWITSPWSQHAVEAMASIAKLRMISAAANPVVPTENSDLANPFLVPKQYEPWAGTRKTTLPLSVRHGYPSYSMVIGSFPRLFDPETIRITADDLPIARRVSPDVEAKVGDIWPFAWHQLRRTGAVNMLASGLVSESSAQYELKHTSRPMTIYYGQGRSRVMLNAEAQTEYRRTMYEVVGKEIGNLFSARYVSPYGEERKAAILKLVDAKDDTRLTAAARDGKVSYRRTLFGGCTKRGACPFGGIDNIIRCGGGDDREPCADALYDRERESHVRRLDQEIMARIEDAPEGSPLSESLHAQKRAVENVLNVIAR
jgi:hypothetical protein